MPRPAKVTITKGDLTGECLPESVPAWEAAGWTVADDGSSESGVQEPVVPDDVDEVAETDYITYVQDDKEEE